jgi:phosphatidylserine/phosphatidylglycerophosphate/cardiolipin synthase-like enzyme
MHFSNLQHNKVPIAKKDGAPLKVLFGSTNFSFRGLYIQANNALVFYAPEAAKLFADVFDLAFKSPRGFAKDPISTKISASRRMPTLTFRSIHWAPRSTKRLLRCSSPSRSSTKPHRARLARRLTGL